MEIDLGNECIVGLQAALTIEQVQEKAMSRRVDVFGQMARFIQRAKPEDIEVSAVQKRYEPFWYVAAKSRFAYDRRHTYRVEVPPEVQEVTVYDHKHQVLRERTGSFDLEAIDHCVEESRIELTLDAAQGQEVDFRKYLSFPKEEVPEIAALEKDGAIVVAPEVRSSFVVRKVVSQLMKTFHADKIYEERIDVEELTLCFRPVYGVEYFWKARNKKQVEDFDAMTGEIKTGSGELKQRMKRVLHNDTLFDIGADTIGMVVPGANIAIKLGRLAAQRAVK